MLINFLQRLRSRSSETAPDSAATPPSDGTIEQRLQQAKHMLRHYRWDEAEDVLTKLIVDSAPAAAFIDLIHLLRIRGYIENAHNITEDALNRFPNNIEVYESAAEFYKQIAAWNKERKLRKRILDLSPIPSVDACEKWLRSEILALDKGNILSQEEVNRVTAFVQEHALDDPEATLRYAEILYAIKAMQDRATELIDRVSPKKSQKRWNLQWTDPSTYCTTKGLRFEASEATYTFNKRDVSPFLAEFRDCIVLPSFQWQPVAEHGHLLPKGYLTWRIRTRRETPGSPLLAHSNYSALLEFPETSMPHIASALLIGGTTNYYHQMVDFVGRLSITERYPDLSDTPLLVDNLDAPFQKEIFALLGIPEERLIPVSEDTPVLVDRLVAPSPVNHFGSAVHPMLVEWFRKRLWPRFASKPYRRIYLSRAETSRRRVVNEAPLIDVLTQFGFESVNPEKLSLRDQIDLFSETAIAVGPTGAALTNIMFMPPGGHVIALYNNILLRTHAARYFDALADAAGLHFRIIPGHSTSCSTENLIDSDFEIDIAAVAQMVKHLVQ